MELRFLDSYESFTSHLADREYFGQKLGLERIQQVLNRLGNPEKKFPSIHIAGTNGKGSTAAMLASILGVAGYRVGLYTSPHLVDFCERIQVRGGMILPEQVLHYARIIHEIETEPLTFFELATAIGFLHFAEEKVDIAVIEVGLGGRLDATNVITPLVSVITSIGLDHTQYLGETIEQIAFEKAGIIKPGVPVVVGELSEEAMRVIRGVALNRESRVQSPESRVGTQDSGLRTQDSGLRTLDCKLAGTHQLHNAVIAVAVIHELKRQDWSISEDAIGSGLSKVRWPGRLETVQEKPWILLDGAHNPQAMTAVREFLGPRLKGRKLKVLFGAMADKDLKGILAEIAPITDQFIFTAPTMQRAASPVLLSQMASMFGRASVVIDGVEQAFSTAREQLNPEEVLLITGSFYVVGEVSKSCAR